MYSGAAGACITLIWLKSASNSSAISMGSVVQILWPISLWASITVMVLSVSMRKKALGAGNFFSSSAAFATEMPGNAKRLAFGIEKAITKPPTA